MTKGALLPKNHRDLPAAERIILTAAGNAQVTFEDRWVDGQPVWRLGQLQLSAVVVPDVGKVGLEIAHPDGIIHLHSGEFTTSNVEAELRKRVAA